MSNGVRFGSLHHGRQRCSRVVGAAGLCGGCGGEPPLMVSIFRVLERRAMLDALMSRSAQSQQISVSSPEISKKIVCAPPPCFCVRAAWAWRAGVCVRFGGGRPRAAEHPRLAGWWRPASPALLGVLLP